MKQITILLLALTLTLTACGGGSGDSTTTASAKDLFSSWAEEGTGFVLDMTHGSFGTFGFTYLITGGAICDCSLTVGGTETSGNAVMSGCAYRSGTGGGSDPGCATLDASYTYTKPASVLTICSAGTCYNYQ